MGSKSVTFKQNTVIYGFGITENESDPTNRVTYLDNAKGMVALYNNLGDGACNYGTWKDSWIFDKVYPVMLKPDGTVDYRLNINDQTQKATGGKSDLFSSSYTGNAMVKVEKFYTKFSMNGSNEEIRISNTKQDGYEAIGFIREDGTEADCFYIGMFGGYKDNSNKLRSYSANPTFNISWTESKQYAEENGDGYGICSWAMDQIFGVLITTLIKSCDWTKKLGEGRKSTSAPGMLYKQGAFAYDPSYQTVKTLWVQDFISNYSGGINWWETGILSQNKKIYVKMQPPYSGTSTNGYTEIKDYVSDMYHWISKMKCDNKYGRYPVEYSSTSNGYECNYWGTVSATTNAYVPDRSGSGMGIWGRDFSRSRTDKGGSISPQLTYLPPK